MLMLIVAGDVMRYSSRGMGEITEIVVRKSNEKSKSFNSLNAIGGEWQYWTTVTFKHAKADPDKHSARQILKSGSWIVKVYNF